MIIKSILILVGLVSTLIASNEMKPPIVHRDFLDFLPPISGWSAISQNIRNDAELQRHMEIYANVFRYALKAEKSRRIDQNTIRTGFLTGLLVSLDATSKFMKILGPKELVYRKDFQEAVDSVLSVLDRPQVQAAVEKVFPPTVLRESITQVYQDIVWVSETPAEAQALLQRFMNWLEFWRGEIRDMDEFALRHIMDQKMHINTIRRKVTRYFRKYRNAVKQGNSRKARHYESHLIHTLNGGNNLTVPLVPMVVALLYYVSLFW